MTKNEKLNRVRDAAVMAASWAPGAALNGLINARWCADSAKAWAYTALHVAKESDDEE